MYKGILTILLPNGNRVEAAILGAAAENHIFKMGTEEFKKIEQKEAVVQQILDKITEHNYEFSLRIKSFMKVNGCSCTFFKPVDVPIESSLPSSSNETSASAAHTETEFESSDEPERKLPKI